MKWGMGMAGIKDIAEAEAEKEKLAKALEPMMA